MYLRSNNECTAVSDTDTTSNDGEGGWLSNKASFTYCINRKNGNENSHALITLETNTLEVILLSKITFSHLSASESNSHRF